MGFLLGGSCSPCCGGGGPPTCFIFENPPDSIRLAISYLGHWRTTAVGEGPGGNPLDPAREYYEVMELGKQAKTDPAPTVYSTAAMLAKLDLMEGTFDLVPKSSTALKMVYEYLSPAGFILSFQATRQYTTASSLVTMLLSVHGGPEIRSLQKSGNVPATEAELSADSWDNDSIGCFDVSKKNVEAGSGWPSPSSLIQFRGGVMSESRGPRYSLYSSDCNNTVGDWPKVSAVDYCPPGTSNVRVRAAHYSGWQGVDGLAYDDNYKEKLASGLISPMNFSVGSEISWPDANTDLATHQVDTQNQGVPAIVSEDGEQWLVMQRWTYASLPLRVTPEPIRHIASRYEITQIAGNWGGSFGDLFRRA